MKLLKTLLVPILLTTYAAFAEEIIIAAPVFPQPEIEKQVAFIEPKGLPEAKASESEYSLNENNARKKPMPIVLDKSGKQVDVTNLNKGQKQ